MSNAIICASCGVLYSDETNNPWCPHERRIPGITTKPRDPLLVERQKTHGSFGTNAVISQELKGIFHKYGTTYGLQHPKSVHLEALDMIALKLSRILSGQANFKDHWDDIAGYAKLGSEACE